MQQSLSRYPNWLPSVLPLFLFLIFTSFEQSFGVRAYPICYTIKIAAVGILLFILKDSFIELRWNSKGVVLAALLGPVLTALWIVVDQLTPHFKFLGSRAAYDPFTSIHRPGLCWLFIVVRFFGLVAVAPLIEEIFYRSFLLRFVINPNDFTKVPLGKYDLTSFVAVVVLMASAHPEYLAAALFSAAMNVLIIRTKNLWATVVAHSSTNLCLGIYVILFHAWKYW